MARKFRGPIELDQEVTDYIRRVGASENPGAFVMRYAVTRDSNGITTITVRFIADNEFSQVTEEIDNG